MRQRYYVFASVCYLLIGLIIVTRAAMAHTLPIIAMGVVFLALGAVRLRDYATWRRSPR